MERPALLIEAVVALPVLLSLAALVDLRQRRIPNLLTFTGMAAGLLVWTWHAGLSGLLVSLLGLLVGGGIFFPFYLARGMGAGDVKLMAAAGAFLGPLHALLAAISVAIVGGAIAAFEAYRQRRLAKALGDAMGALSGGRPLKTLDGCARRDAIPYGVAIAAGVLLYVLIAAFAGEGR